MIKPRYKRFLEELPRNGNKMLPSAIKAGYSESYARARSKRILKTAVKETAKEVIAQSSGEITLAEGKKLMSDIVGLSKQDIMNRLVHIANQDKDYGSALKVLAPLSKEHGVILQADDEQKQSSAPVLNLSFGSVSIAENKAKNIESVIEHKPIESQEIEKGLTEP